VKTIAGDGMSLYRQEPELQGGEIVYRDGPAKSHNEKILAALCSLRAIWAPA